MSKVYRFYLNFTNIKEIQMFWYLSSFDIPFMKQTVRVIRGTSRWGVKKWFEITNV